MTEIARLFGQDGAFFTLQREAVAASSSKT